MPELPEVETVRRQLHERLRGKTLLAVDVIDSGRELPRGEEFARALVGRIISSIDRRAKILIFRFSDGGGMLGHLKMTGRFTFCEAGAPVTKHDRIHFVFSNDIHVRWSDIRRFGYLRLMSGEEIEKALSAYGPEPLQSDVATLAERLLTPKTRTMKAALLDQATIAGCGNIYADEACHRAGVLPTRRLGTLSPAERTAIASSLKDILAESLAQRGTSAKNYVDTAGGRGGFVTLLKVYGRKNQPCQTCATPIEKVTLSGRGTHFCSHCQK